MAKHSFSWRHWQPGLNNDHLTMKEVFESLPGHDSVDISFHVKLFENPTSPFAYKGAIDLEPHDCIHILLGRGLFGQDEGFVIGFTMGTNDLPNWQYKSFQWITQYFYKKPYKFSKNDVVSYKLGVGYGQEVRKLGLCKDIQNFDFLSETNFNKTIGELRKELGIDKAELRARFKKEQLLAPNTKASLRLPVDPNVTMTQLRDIEGEYCDWYDEL